MEILRTKNRITTTGAAGINLIKSFEGFVAKPYLCPAGVPTIGYGATYYPNGKRVTMQDKAISEPQACELLAHMLTPYEKAVDSFTTDAINQNQFDALVSFAYNVGVGALKGSSLLKKVNANTNDASITASFMAWNKARNKQKQLVPLAGLTRRRTAEARLYFAI